MTGAVLELGIDLNVWPWIWLVVGVFFAAIELTLLAGNFVLLPFAMSAFAASLLGFYDVSIEIQWATFLIGGALLWVLLYRRVMKFADTNELAPGVGADRLVGLDAIVTVTIDPDDTERSGRVKVLGEIWSALSFGDVVIPKGSKVLITAVHGTRVLVEPTWIAPSTEPRHGSTPPPPPPPSGGHGAATGPGSPPSPTDNPSDPSTNPPREPS